MFTFFSAKKQIYSRKSEFQFNTDGPIPQHIAIIMDGNGRWEKQTSFCHELLAIKRRHGNSKVTKKASRLGVKVLTLYAFST